LFFGEPKVPAKYLDGRCGRRNVSDTVRIFANKSVAVAAAINAGGQVALAEIQLDTGTRRTLSRFDTGRTCELGTQTCHAFDLHLATGLLPDLIVRSAGRP
jgi:hypothetical protein